MVFLLGGLGGQGISQRLGDWVVSFQGPWPLGLVEEWEGKDYDLDLGSLDLVEEREAMVSLLLAGLEVEVYPQSGPLHLAEVL